MDRDGNGFRNGNGNGRDDDDRDDFRRGPGRMRRTRRRTARYCRAPKRGRW
jgi:hypothetical protein